MNLKSQVSPQKDPIERIIFLSQVFCSVILCNWVSVSPELLVQVVLTTTLPGTFHVGIHKPKENDNHN